MTRTHHRAWKSLALGAFFSLTVSVAQAQETVVACLDVGLTPEAVVAAGLHGEVATILSRVQGHLALREALANQRENVSQAGEQVALIQAELRMSDGAPALTAQYEAALTQFATARTDYARAQAALRAVALEGMAPSAITRIELAKANSVYEVSPEFGVVKPTV